MLVFPETKNKNGTKGSESSETIQATSSTTSSHLFPHPTCSCFVQENEHEDYGLGYGMVKDESEYLLMPCSSPLQLDYLNNAPQEHDITPTSLHMFRNQSCSTSSAASTIDESIYRQSLPLNTRIQNNIGFQPIRSCLTHYSHPYSACPQHCSDHMHDNPTNSSIPTSEESTPFPHAFNSKMGQQSSSGITLDITPHEGPSPSTCQLGSPDDALFNQHMEMLFEFNSSPEKNGHRGWIDILPEGFSDIYQQQQQPATFSFASCSNPPLPKFSHAGGVVSQEGKYPQHIPWLRTINRSAFYNQQLPHPHLSNLQPIHFAKDVTAVSHESKVTRRQIKAKKDASGVDDRQQQLSKDGDDDSNTENNNEDMNDSDTDEYQCSDRDSDNESEEWSKPSTRKRRRKNNKTTAGTTTATNQAGKRPRRAKTMKEDLDDDDNDVSKPRRKASEAARNVLMNWLVENEDHPYPSKKQKLELAAATGLSLKQIVHWMSNIRKRRMIPLLSGRRQPSSSVDVKFLEDIDRRRNLMAGKK